MELHWLFYAIHISHSTPRVHFASIDRHVAFGVIRNYVARNEEAGESGKGWLAEGLQIRKSRGERTFSESF